MSEVKNILSEQDICEKFSVTPAQIDKASRIVNGLTGEVFYQVESQTTDATYEVHYNKKYNRTVCNCEAAKNGIPCWHKRASRAAAFEARQAERIAMAKEAEAARLASILRSQKEARQAVDARLTELYQQRETARRDNAFSLLK